MGMQTGQEKGARKDSRGRAMCNEETERESGLIWCECASVCMDRYVNEIFLYIVLRVSAECVSDICCEGE